MTATPARRRLAGWRRETLAALAMWAAALAFGGATAAFACVPQPLASVEPTSSGAAGATATLVGVRFSGGPAEVRWNAVDGPLLATATGPDFRADFQVPAERPGLYTLIALSRSADGSVGVAARASFAITDATGLLPVAATAKRAGHAAGGGWSGLAVAGSLAAGALVGAGAGALAARSRWRPGAPAPSRRPADVPSPAS